jgi:diguanylate cyclase (GGDEF)-like protein/PAS domain S-box-containing protein
MERWLKRIANLYGTSRIRTRFFLIVLTLSVPFFAFIMISAIRQAESERQTALNSTVDVARSVALRLDDYVQQMDSLIGTLGASVSVSVDDRPRNDVLFEKARVSFPKFVNNVAVWDLDGNNVGSLDSSLLTRSFNIRDRKYFRDALEDHGLAIEAPVVSRSNGEYIAEYARAIHDDQGKVIGVISASTQLRHLQDLVDPRNALPDGSLVSIVSLDGTILARTVDPQTWIGTSVVATPGFRTNAGHQEGSDVRIGIDGIARVAAFQTAKRAPWRVFVGIPADTIYVPARDHFFVALGLGLALLLLAAVAAGFVARSMSEPIARLVTDAARFGQGQLNYRTTEHNVPELTELANAMNRMAASLEARVAERRRAEEALAAEKERIKVITDNVPALIAYVGADTRFQFANKTYKDWSNREPESLIGVSIRDFATEVGLVDPQRYIEEALAGNRVVYEQQFVNASGTRYILVTCIPDLDEGSHVRGVFLLGSDISEAKRAEMLIMQSEARLKTITDSIPALVCYIDRSHTFRFNNKTYEKWLRKPISQITNVKVADVYGPTVYVDLAPTLERALKGESLRFEIEFAGFDGTRRFARGEYIPEFNADGEVLGVYGLTHDVTKLKLAEDKLWNLAQFDTLTGVANRSHFNQRLEEAIVTADERGSVLAILFLDIDKFKVINDRFGHHAGDELLVEFAKRLQRSVRPTDIVSRLGGDEFVILLPELHTADEAQFVARKILNAMTAPFAYAEHPPSVSTSIGIAIRHPGETNATALMKRADDALYAAKAAGRNTSKTIG